MSNDSMTSAKPPGAGHAGEKGLKKLWEYTRELVSDAAEKMYKSKPFRYAVLAAESIPLLAAINNSYAEDLKVTNRIRNTNQAVKYGKVYLMENGAAKDSLILDINGSGTFRNVPTPVEWIEKAPEYFSISNTYPNPAKGSVSAEIEVPYSDAMEAVKCEIFDVTGRKVKDFESRYGPGTYRMTWDGTNNSGAGVADGVYFLRASTQSGSKAAKFVYMKGSPEYGSNFSKIAEPEHQMPSNALKKSGGAESRTYQLKFGNSEATDPKIKSWTTEPFVFSADKDTTVYSDKLPVSVSGIVMDAYARTPVAGAKVKAKYENTGKIDSTTTDASGNYLIEFEPVDADTSKFTVDASKQGFYSYREWPKTMSTELKDTLHTFEQFTDPENAESSDPRKDLLEYIKYMHQAVNPRDTTYTFIHRWRNQDLTLKTFIDTTSGYNTAEGERYFNPGKSGLDMTRSAIKKCNIILGKNRIKEISEVSRIDEAKLRIYYGEYGSRSYDKKEKNTVTGVSYPVSGWIDLFTDSTGTPRFDEASVLHEIGHIWWTSGVHSPFHNHLVSDNTQNTFSDFEVRAIDVLYNLPNTVTSSDPPVVKKYLLHKE